MHMLELMLQAGGKLILSSAYILTTIIETKHFSLLVQYRLWLNKGLGQAKKMPLFAIPSPDKMLSVTLRLRAVF